MPSLNGYPTIARGSLATWVCERQASQAVDEEQGEIARMQADVAAHAHLAVANAFHDAEALAQQIESVPESHTYELHAPAPDAQVPFDERAALIARVQLLSDHLVQTRNDLAAARATLSVSRSVMADILGSRVYNVLRLCGRWRSVEKGIQRSLR
jgi:hypothetical protein